MVDVVLQYDGEEKQMSPGKPYALEFQEDEWILFITGASLPARGETSLSGPGESSPLTGEPGKTADEEPAFIIDCILYRK